jgi:hypothetical protein
LTARDTEALEDVFGTLRKYEKKLDELKEEMAECKKVRGYIIKNYL